MSPFARFCFRVSHCMFRGVSGPPQAKGMTWSTSWPGQEPVVRPVEGRGAERRKVERADLERLTWLRLELERELARWQW